MKHVYYFDNFQLQAAKEFETELKKDTDPPLESPEYITRVREEEKQEAEVSSMESS